MAPAMYAMPNPLSGRLGPGGGIIGDARLTEMVDFLPHRPPRGKAAKQACAIDQQFLSAVDQDLDEIRGRVTGGDFKIECQIGHG